MGATVIGRPPTSVKPTPASRELAWLVPILVMLSLIALVVGLLAFVNEAPTSHLSGQMSALTHRVGALEARVRAQQHALVVERHRRVAAERTARSTLAALRATSDTSASAADLNLLHAHLNGLAHCNAQLQRELAALRLQTSDINGWLTGVTLMRPVPPSACAPY